MKSVRASQVGPKTNLGTIVANQQWLEALRRWCAAEGRPCDQNSPPFDLTIESWKALLLHLLATGWFETASDGVRPNQAGHDFLVRVSELCRAIGRQSKQDRVVAEALEGFPKGPAVDIGCGPGLSVLRLARLGYSPVYAYDLSPVALDIARALLDNEERSGYLYARDATPLAEVQTSSLAVVFSRGALHYFNQRELARTFARTLRPGGHLVAEVVGLNYYLQTKHLKNLLQPRRLRKTLSYARTVLRTLIFEACTLQLRLAGAASEIGLTERSVRRLARWAGLEVVSLSPALTTVGGYLVVMRKPD